MFTGSLLSNIAGGAALGALVGGTIALALNRSDSVERFAAIGAVMGGWAGVGSQLGRSL